MIAALSALRHGSLQSPALKVGEHFGEVIVETR
jgi:hypothetical protein